MNYNNIIFNIIIMSFKIVSVEGNIGAGKTTILNKMQKENTDTSIVFIREPVDMWESFKDNDGNTIISKFYENPEKYSFQFQVMAFTTRLFLLKDTIEKNPNAKIFICERSLEADKEIFANMLHNDKLMDDISFKIYKQYFQDSLNPLYKLSGIIYINTSPVTSFERIAIRNREGESNITMTYLEKCHNAHKLWLHNFDKPILSIDSNYTIGKLFQINKFLQDILIQQ